MSKIIAEKKKTKRTEVIDSDSNYDSDTSLAVLEKIPKEKEVQVMSLRKQKSIDSAFNYDTDTSIAVLGKKSYKAHVCKRTEVNDSDSNYESDTSCVGKDS